MNLLGTELAPDFHLYDGQFNCSEISRRLEEKGPAGPFTDELIRYKASDPDLCRYHHRYVAAGHAWDAAELLPDNDAQTARVLYDAGCWIKDRDPKAADKFYKSLVRRCPQTALGEQAAELHWFPKPQQASVKN